MQFMAIVEERPTRWYNVHIPMHWYVHIPALATGGPVPELKDVHACAVALAAAATGLPAAEVEVLLSHAVPGVTLLPASSTEVEVRHKGIWRAAQQTGWLREWSGSWWPLVEYAADGARWTRAVRVSGLRQPGLPVAAVPEPRGGESHGRLNTMAAMSSA